MRGVCSTCFRLQPMPQRRRRHPPFWQGAQVLMLALSAAPARRQRSWPFNRPWLANIGRTLRPATNASTPTLNSTGAVGAASSSSASRSGLLKPRPFCACSPRPIAPSGPSCVGAPLERHHRCSCASRAGCHLRDARGHGALCCRTVAGSAQAPCGRPLAANIGASRAAERPVAWRGSSPNRLRAIF